MRVSATGAAILVLMPLGMWLANRSAPLFLGLAAAAFVAAVFLQGRREEFVARLRRALSSPLALVLLAFAAWSLLSAGWSHRPGAGLNAWGELVLPVVFGLLIAATALFRPTPALLRALALSLILASILMIVELSSGLSQRTALGLGKMMTFVFNRPVLVCLLLSVPVLHGLWRSPAGTRRDRALAVLLAVAVLAATFRSESEAAKLGVLVAAIAWAGAALLPRIALAATALAFVVTMALAPFAGQLADRELPPSFHESIEGANSRSRVDIWLSFGEAARARPFVGSGIASSATLQDNPVASQVSEAHRVLLGVGHPHSMPLQAWVETGLVGVLLLSATGLLLLARLRHLPRADLAPRLALFAAAFSVATVGHGAWQGWWIAGLAAAILWFVIGHDRPDVSKEERHG